MDTKVISASCLVAMAAVLVRLIYKMATDFRWFMTISTGMLILYIIGTMAIEIGLYYIVLAMKDIDDAREAMEDAMYYNECSQCGAYLDPGEHCDCEEERQRQTQRIMSMIRENKNNNQYELVLN